jgi:hypothetical protein
VRTATIKLSIALMVEAVLTSDTSVCFNEVHGSVSQKGTIFILAAARTLNLTYLTFLTTLFSDTSQLCSYRLLLSCRLVSISKSTWRHNPGEQHRHLPFMSFLRFMFLIKAEGEVRRPYATGKNVALCIFSVYM